MLLPRVTLACTIFPSSSEFSASDFMSMPRSYRRFSREFKMQIVESILKGAVASHVAKANDLHPEGVRKWGARFQSVPERCLRRSR
jgi:hypothetical protein